MKIKNYIITRFFSEYGSMGDIIFDKEFLLTQFELMKSNIVNSLNNLTNKNFEFIVLIHDDIDYDKVMFLEELKDICEFHVTIIRISELSNYIKKHYKDYDYVVESRMDFDDFIFDGVIDDINKNVIGYPLKMYGYSKGYTYQSVNDTFYSFDMTSVNSDGHWGIMSTISFSKEFLDKCSDYTIYHFNHEHSLYRLKERVTALGYEWNDEYWSRNEDMSDAFIYYRHPLSYSLANCKQNNNNVDVLHMAPYSKLDFEEPSEFRELVLKKYGLKKINIDEHTA